MSPGKAKYIPASLILFLGFSELLLRLQEPWLHFFARYDFSQSFAESLGQVQGHPLWHHTRTPGYRGTATLPSGDQYTIATNRQGFHHPDEVSKQKAEGVFRIFVMGDSFTEGFGAGWRVSDWIEKELIQRFPDKTFEVINAATASHCVLLYAVRLRFQLLELLPDLVIVNVDQTDVHQDLWYLKDTFFDDKGFPVAVKGPFAKRDAFRIWSERPGLQLLRSLGHYSQVARIAWVAASHIGFRKITKAEGVSSAGIDGLPPYRDYDWVFHKELNEKETAWLEQWGKVVGKMIRECKNNGVPIFVSTYPHPQQIYRDGNRHMDKMVREICEKESVPYFDAYKSIVSNRESKLYWDMDIHFNKLGQQVWGRTLAQWVSDRIEDVL